MASFHSLADALANCFDKTLTQLSPAQRGRVVQELGHVSWDGISPDERRAEAKGRDIQQHFDELESVERDKAYWESRSDVSASDAAVRQDRLAAINKRHAELIARHEVLRGDFDLDDQTSSTAGESTATPAGWKMKIQIEAAAHMKRLRSSGANPTVSSILDRMVKWCVENNVRTDGGVVPSANYMRTHVLGGKYWTPPA